MMENTFDLPRQFWHDVLKYRAHVYYLRRHQFVAESMQWRVDVFLALTTSSSVAAWAVWGQYPLVWASIVAVSQV